MTRTDRTDALVSTDWLAEHLNAPDIRIVDATYDLPWEKEEEPPSARFERAHIPGAVFFDIDDIADTSSDLPHTVPPPEKFSSKVRRLGLGDGSRIVVYDQKGIRTAPRVWWMFRLFGHQDVAVLDGGLPKWQHENRRMDDGAPRITGERHFTARMNNTMLYDLEQMKRNLETKRAQVVDGRSAARFLGEGEEPRPDVRRGRIPGSFNVPHSSLVDQETGTLKSGEELTRIFKDAGVDPKKPVVTLCGSGVTSCTLALALRTIGAKDVAVYDGSWAEWGRPGDTPVETGTPEA